MKFLLFGHIGGQAVGAIRESERRCWSPGLKLRQDFRDSKRAQAVAIRD